ncbi:unnamed protein product [Parascedosporium putredinis]|uniref:Uncharacterized protein n=1 Tax=Parascedosporium putredinis TaxID=1442378 RepID=A0A9P1GUH2_9PEZI|nr:unnamed protein product [Parascedosporium putredinis]CAI7987573.1 unnamed protein product [Parascedosporium putredinis]
MPAAARSESNKGLSTESVLVICLGVSTIVFLALGLVLVEIRGHPRAASPWSIRSARQWGQAWRNTDDYRGEERESLVYNNTMQQMQMPQAPRLGYLRDGLFLPTAATMSGAADRSQDPHYQARPAWLPISPPHHYFSSPNLPRDLYQQGQPQPYPRRKPHPLPPAYLYRRGPKPYPPFNCTKVSLRSRRKGQQIPDQDSRKAEKCRRAYVRTHSPGRTNGDNTPASGGQEHTSLPRVPTMPPKAASHRSVRSRDSASTYSYNPSSIQSTPRRTEAGGPRTGLPTTPARSDPEVYTSTPFARPISSPRSMVRLRVPPKLSDPSLQTQHARVASWPPRLDQSKVNITPTHPPQPHSPLWSHPVDPALRHSLRKRALSESSVAMHGVMPG